MSIHGKMGSFLNAENLVVALNEEDLDLPEDKKQEGVQRYRFAPNAIVAVYNATKRKLGYFQAISVNKHAGGVWRWTFESTLGGGRIHLSYYQISVLEQQGRIRPLENGQERREAKKPDDLLAVEPKNYDAAMRRHDYCLALVKAEDGGRVKLTGSVIKKVAIEVATERGDKKVPCRNILDIWLARYKRQPWNRLLALVTGTSKGNTSARFDYHLEALISECIKEVWQDPGGKGTHVIDHLRDALDEDENKVLKKSLTKDGRLQLPHRDTLARRFYQINRYVRDVWRFGEEVAARNHGLYTGQPLPDHALGVVEVDYTVGDITVYHDDLPILFGRPYVIFLRERKTGSIIGFGVHFENPSYNTFLATLRQAIYPKDMSEYPGLKWMQYGQMICLVVDNAKFFVGDDMRHACKTLGIDLLENRPGEPNGKGSVEQMFSQANQQVFHRLPGTTLSNTEKRKQFPESKGLGKPVIFLSTLIQYITLWIAEYHDTPRKGIGKNPSVKKSPNQAWIECAPDIQPRLPIDPHLFVSLAGDTDELTIQKDGITWDHIKYCSADLLVLHTHPKNNRRKAGKESTRYRVKRDPSDLGRIWVVDPYRNASIEVPAVGTWKKYADGLPLHQHDLIVKFHNTTSKKAIEEAEDLLSAKRSLNRKLRERQAEQRLGKQAQATIMGFHSQMTRKLNKAQIVSIPESAEVSGELFDLDNPQKVGRSGAKSPRDPKAYQGTPERHVTADPEFGVAESDPQATAVAERTAEAASTPKKPKSGPRHNKPSVSTSDDELFNDPDALAAMLKDMGF